MNRLNLLLLAALLPLAVFAQGGATSSQVLADVEKTITSYGAFTVELDIDGMKSELTVNADKFYLSSADANVWYDGSTLWTYIKDAGEVNLATSLPTPSSGTGRTTSVTNCVARRQATPSWS